MFTLRLLKTVLISAVPAIAFAAPMKTPIVQLAANMQMDQNSAPKADAFAPVTIGDLKITAAALKAMTPGQPVGSGFVTITNNGTSDDRLMSVDVAKGADHVELHEMKIDNDVMTMRKLADGLPLPAGQTVEMKPGALHMMIMGVKAPFKAGETVHLTLTFEKAGRVELDAPVQDMRPGMKNMKM